MQIQSLFFMIYFWFESKIFAKISSNKHLHLIASIISLKEIIFLRIAINEYETN